MDTYAPFVCRDCTPHRLCQGMGQYKHNFLMHKQKDRCLKCLVCGACDVWWEDFKRHLLKAHGIEEENIGPTAQYMVEGLPVFHQLRKCPRCWFRHYDQDEVDLHASSCGIEYDEQISKLSAGRGVPPKKSPPQTATKSTSTSPRVNPQTISSTASTSSRSTSTSSVTFAPPAPGEMVGVGARAKVPKDLTMTDPKGTLSDVAANPFTDVVRVLLDAPASRPFTSETGRDTRRACDNMAAERHMEEQQRQINELDTQLHEAKQRIAKPRDPAVNWLNVSHVVSTVAYMAPRSPNKSDQRMARLVLDMCPLFAGYDIRTDDGAVLGKALVEPHNRNYEDYVPYAEVVEERREYRYMGLLYSTAGPWTLLGRLHLTFVRRAGKVLLVNPEQSPAVIQATFVPPDEWDVE